MTNEEIEYKELTDEEVEYIDEMASFFGISREAALERYLSGNIDGLDLSDLNEEE